MKQNLAFFVISTELGGAEKSLLDFLKPFHSLHKNLIVFTPKSSGPLIDELNAAGISVREIPLPLFLLSLSRKKVLKSLLLLIPSLFYSFIYLSKIHNAIKGENFSAIHSTGLKYHIFLSFISFLHPNSRFYIHMRDILRLKLLKRLLSFFNTRKNIHFIFNSKATAESLPQISGTVIYNGFDSHFFTPGSSSLKQDLGIPNECKVVAVVGVIARWKGQREFLRMAQSITSSMSNVHFIIVGDEIYDTLGEKGELATLKKTVQELNLQSKIHFMGFQKDIERIYRGIDVLVHCSIEPEPFGRVLVEAMLCGCPVVASNQGGPLEIIEDGKNGLLYNQANVESMTQKVETLLSNQDLMKSLALSGRKRAEDFSLESSMKSLSQKLLGHSANI